MAPFPFRPHTSISKLKKSNYLFPLTCRKSSKLIDLAQPSKKILPVFEVISILGVRGK
jgi:hypothetical protein